jgi:glycosyltransferase involved in cell wall biosynthesis
VQAARRDYAAVDVALVMESTYPYLKGGLAAVVHDIVVENPDISFGVIHISWDSDSPSEDLYGMPANVAWVRPIYLSIQEHRHSFMQTKVQDLHMTSREREQLTDRLFDAAEALAGERDVEPLWELLDDGLLESTRRFPLWALLGSSEFMAALPRRFPKLGMSLSDTFWTMREFFSLAYALLHETMPRAAVYHSHTTGYAALVAAAAAREHDTTFLLTEHNLYVRDTVNTLLDRNMALGVTSTDYREFMVTPKERAWMAWWTEIGHFCYPSASLITYLYPGAITEAAALGTDRSKAVVVPNGMPFEDFEDQYRARLAATEKILKDPAGHVWRLTYIARLVPIKGLLDLLDSLAMLRDRGLHNIHLDVLGPTEHFPEYTEKCLARIKALKLDDMVTIHGTVDVRGRLDRMDLLVMPSYNEGQPIVALETMSAAIPCAATRVGGMGQLAEEVLTSADGETFGPCGILTEPGDVKAMADAIETIVRAPRLYAEFGRNARHRVEAFFQIKDVMGLYHGIYSQLGTLGGIEDDPEPGGEDLTGPPSDQDPAGPSDTAPAAEEPPSGAAPATDKDPLGQAPGRRTGQDPLPHRQGPATLPRQPSSPGAVAREGLAPRKRPLY